MMDCLKKGLLCIDLCSQRNNLAFSKLENALKRLDSNAVNPRKLIQLNNTRVPHCIKKCLYIIPTQPGYFRNKGDIPRQKPLFYCLKKIVHSSSIILVNLDVNLNVIQIMKHNL